ncbi:MAG: hypothetical protein FJX74_04455 [Armatimonadetes bacterium]|nr:hypothetical protein [Armatimonadota bacterium]
MTNRRIHTLLAVILCVILIAGVLSLVGCGKKKENSQAEGERRIDDPSDVMNQVRSENAKMGKAGPGGSPASGK